MSKSNGKTMVTSFGKPSNNMVSSETFITENSESSEKKNTSMFQTLNNEQQKPKLEIKQMDHDSLMEIQELKFRNERLEQMLRNTTRDYENEVKTLKLKLQTEKHMHKLVIEKLHHDSLMEVQELKFEKKRLEQMLRNTTREHEREMKSLKLELQNEKDQHKSEMEKVHHASSIKVQELEIQKKSNLRTVAKNDELKKRLESATIANEYLADKCFNSESEVAQLKSLIRQMEEQEASRITAGPQRCCEASRSAIIEPINMENSERRMCNRAEPRQYFSSRPYRKPSGNS